MENSIRTTNSHLLTFFISHRPTYKGESEVSVYDLKDHPDFQFRPGTIVIRVANFIGEDTTCTAGQVIDNYSEGQVKVWWVDGHVSKCWPQDLFEVGQYDSENNFWSNAESDNESWVTEDEISEPGGNLVEKEVSKPQIVTNLERARVAMSRLEEMFMINPSLQNQEVMKKLLMVYKKCRFLDRLMNTSFFHEENFLVSDDVFLSVELLSYQFSRAYSNVSGKVVAPPPPIVCKTKKIACSIRRPRLTNHWIARNQTPK
jgi:hypothetical protein